jgi:hypothetical protein
MKNLKILLIVVIVLLSCGAGFGQSPYYSINITIPPDHTINPFRYEIKFKLCLPNKYSTGGDWFDRDTTILDTENPGSEYFNNLNCSSLESESDDNFSYGNQMMAYESTGNILITQYRNNNTDTMRIVFLVTRKSFVTSFNLKDLEFRPGTYNITDGLEYNYDEHLSIALRKGYEWSEVRESSLWRE